MKNYCKDFWEVGGQMAVFAGEYLGCGKTIITLDPLWQEMRRDDFQPLQNRSLKKLQAVLTLELPSGDRVWEALNKFEPGVFTDGGVLQLYSMDSRRKGYEFKRVFFNGLEHVSENGELKNNVKVQFICETCDGADELFSCIPEASFPENIPLFSPIDLKKLMRYMGITLADKLGVVFDHTLCIDFFAPDPRGAYSLELESCRDWGGRTCGIFDMKLTARFPLSEKFFIEQKLYDTARFLDNEVFELEDNSRLFSRMRDIDFGSCKNNGSSCTDSTLRFFLTVI